MLYFLQTKLLKDSKILLILFLFEIKVNYRVFFYFGLFDMFIIWSFFEQNLVLGHFSYLQSVHILLRKFGEKNFKTQNFTAVFVKVTIFRNMGKILFLPFSIFSIFNFFQIQMPNSDNFC
jgi:hypothetical protein